mmetsp:Transcript_120155/g.340084  ORF Transcript_120155/g.340084 Transcript_120155/m.340084 type:complete len:292 (-) Transcript_120155:3116-3991(-)
MATTFGHGAGGVRPAAIVVALNGSGDKGIFSDVADPTAVFDAEPDAGMGASGRLNPGFGPSHSDSLSLGMALSTTWATMFIFCFAAFRGLCAGVPLDFEEAFILNDVNPSASESLSSSLAHPTTEARMLVAWSAAAAAGVLGTPLVGKRIVGGFRRSSSESLSPPMAADTCAATQSAFGSATAQAGLDRPPIIPRSGLFGAVLAFVNALPFTGADSNFNAFRRAPGASLDTRLSTGSSRNTGKLSHELCLPVVVASSDAACAFISLIVFFIWVTSTLATLFVAAPSRRSWT